MSALHIQKADSAVQIIPSWVLLCELLGEALNQAQALRGTHVVRPFALCGTSRAWARWSSVEKAAGAAATRSGAGFLGAFSVTKRHPFKPPS